MLTAVALRRRLRIGVVGCVVASLLVPVLRWWRRGIRGSIGPRYRAWRLEALAGRRSVAVAVVGTRLLRWWRHGFSALCSLRAVLVEELGSLFWFGVSGGRVSSQPFVARPVNVRMAGHDFTRRAREARGKSEGRGVGVTYAGRASGLYPRL